MTAKLTEDLNKHVNLLGLHGYHIASLNDRMLVAESQLFKSVKGPNRCTDSVLNEHVLLINKLHERITELEKPLYKRILGKLLTWAR